MRLVLERSAPSCEVKDRTNCGVSLSAWRSVSETLPKPGPLDRLFLAAREHSRRHMRVHMAGPLADVR